MTWDETGGQTMGLVAQIQQTGWDYRMWIWLAVVAVVALILFLGALATVLGRESAE